MGRNLGEVGDGGGTGMDSMLSLYRDIPDAKNN